MPTQQTATIRYLRIAPRKVRAIANLVKGLSVNEAEAQLVLQPRRPAGALLKLLRACVANAKQNQRLGAAEIERFMIASIRVDGGPMLKRSLPRARGKADPIQRKMSHVTLVLEAREVKRPNRFVIARPEKKKTGPEGESRRKKRPKIEEGKKEAPGKPGFFRRMFTRKSV